MSPFRTGTTSNLNTNYFTSVRHARESIETWRRNSSEVKPRNSLMGRPPKEYAEGVAPHLPLIPITG